MRDLVDELLRAKVKARLFGGDHAPRLGRLILVDRIGAGAMGTVFAAYDPRLDREVAVKVLDGGAAAERVLREARALGKLAHPNVVAIHDADELDGAVYIVMELARGVPLGAWLASERRPWRDVVRVLGDAGAGIAAAHAAGLVHRDIKPANILIGTDRARVVDFGLAADPGSDATGAGTPSYMAPELLAGGAATEASDQFSFGVTLYEALYGARPHGGASREELRTSALVAAELSRASESAAFRRAREVPDVPGWLHATVVRMLAPEPASRFPSMTAVVTALHRDRRRRTAIAAVALPALVLGAALGAVAFRHRGVEPCTGGAERREAVWSAAARERVEHELGAVAWRAKALEDLDATANRWEASFRAVCEATRVRGEQSDALLELRMRCLDRALERFGALAGAFGATGPADGDDGAGSAATRGASRGDDGPGNAPRGASRGDDGPGNAPRGASRGDDGAASAATRGASRGDDGAASAATHGASRGDDGAGNAPRGASHGDDGAGNAATRGRLAGSAAMRGGSPAEAAMARGELATATAELPDPAACELLADPAELALPADLATRTRVTSAERALDRAWAAYELGRYGDAKPAIAVLLRETEPLGVARLSASVALLAGMIDARTGDAAQARGELDRALHDAAAAHATALEVAVWAPRLRLELFSGNPAHVIDWAPFAHAAAARAGLDGAELDGVIGEALRDAGQLGAARERLQRARASRDPLRPDQRALIELNLGAVELAAGNLGAARAAFERGHALVHGLYGDGHPALALYLDKLAAADRASGKLAAALARHDESLALRTAAFGDADRSVATSLYYRGVTLLEAGLLARATHDLESARELRAKLYGAQSPRLGEIEVALGDVALAAGAPAEARAHYTSAQTLDRRLELAARRVAAGAPIADPAKPLPDAISLDALPVSIEPFSVDRAAALAIRVAHLTPAPARGLATAMLGRWRVLRDPAPALSLAVGDALLAGGDRTSALAVYTAGLAAIGDESSITRQRLLDGKTRAVAQ